jgi:hypothetical protein
MKKNQNKGSRARGSARGYGRGFVDENGDGINDRMRGGSSSGASGSKMQGGGSQAKSGK